MIRSKQAIAVAIAGLTTVLAVPPVYAQDPAPSPDASTAPAGTVADTPAPVPSPSPSSAPAPAPVEAGGAIHAETGARVPGEGAPPAAAKPAVPAWMEALTIGGGVLAYFYQPLGIDGAENNVSIFFANLLLDGKWGRFGLHFEPRIRDTKLRPFYDGPVWLQEAYASVDLGIAELRVGKTYNRLGLFWDNSFYGNVQVYDGLKLDPDYGLSLGGEVGKKDDLASLGFWAQYFVVDGGTNVSLQGRDTISIPGARRRNQAVARLEPRFRLGSTTLAVGASGEYLQAADLPVIGTQNVWRGAADAKLTVGGLGLWGEFTHQDGRSVTDFPITGTPATATAAAIPGQSSSKINYVLAGAEYTVGPVTARYNFSLGDYSDVSVKETMHVPALGLAVSPNLSFLAELVIWRRYTPVGDSLVDRSFNLTMNAHL